MGGWRDHVLAHRHAPEGGDLLADLLGRQKAALAGLGPLGELDLDRLDRLEVGQLAQLPLVERAVGRAHAELGRAHLPDQVAALLHVVLRPAPLAGVHRDPRPLRPPREGQHRRLAQGAEAHGADEQRPAQIEGPLRPALLAQDQGEGLQVLDRDRVQRVPELDLGPVVEGLRPEGQGAIDPLGLAVHLGALLPVERAFLVVAGEEVLAQLRPDALDQVACLAQHAEVAQDRVAGLDVAVAEVLQGEQQEGDRPEVEPEGHQEPRQEEERRQAGQQEVHPTRQAGQVDLQGHAGILRRRVRSETGIRYPRAVTCPRP